MGIKGDRVRSFCLSIIFHDACKLLYGFIPDKEVATVMLSDTLCVLVL